MPDQSHPENSTDSFLYFAYGSNMLSRRLRARTPSANVLCTATLAGHRLTFDKHGDDGSAKCHITPSTGRHDRVYGVIFRIALKDRPALDIAEGLGRGYTAQEFLLTAATGKNIRAMAYTAIKLKQGLRPYRWYKEFVVAGAREHGLPTEYIQKLDDIKVWPDPDPVRRKLNESILQNEA